MINQTTDLKNYSNILDNLKKSFIDPLLKGKLLGETPLFKWKTPPSSFGEDTLNRCSYDSYKEIKKENNKITSLSDAVVFAHTVETAGEPLNNLIHILGQETGFNDLSYSNKPIYYKNYQKQNGFMGWHTNSDYPGDRWYFVYNTNDDSSFMRYINPNTEEMITEWEPKGWSLNHCMVGDYNKPLWHCVYTKNHRISFGIRRIESLNQFKWKNVSTI